MYLVYLLNMHRVNLDIVTFSLTGSNSCGVSKNPSQSDKDGPPSDNVVTDIQLLQPWESELPVPV